MAETTWPKASNGRVVNDVQWEKMMTAFAGDGVVGTPADDPVIYADGTGMYVKVRPNKYAHVKGHMWDSGTSEFTKTIAANNSGLTRYDRVILRLNRTTWEVTSEVLQGVAGGSIPALTQDATGTASGVFEVSLGIVTVNTGVGNIAANKLTIDTNYVGPAGGGARVAIDGAAGTLSIYNASGELVAQMSGDGDLAVNSLSVNSDDVTIDGESLAERLDGTGKGRKAYGEIPTGSYSYAANTEGTVLELEVAGETGRSFDLTGMVHGSSNSVGDTVQVRIRDGGASQPTTSSTLLLAHDQDVGIAGNGVTLNVFKRNQALATGRHRLLITVKALNGTFTFDNAWLDVLDSGLVAVNNGVNRTSGATPPPNPPQTYTTNYFATWSGSYTPAGNYGTFGGSTRAYQGDANEGSGNRKSMIGFNYSQIASDLSGATILSCKITLYYQHWWYNNGGTAVIGTHNAAVSSAPSTFSGTTNRVQSASWPIGQSRSVELGTTIGNEFKAATAKGIVLGPGPSSSTTYYGYASGYGATNPPYLTIQYQK